MKKVRMEKLKDKEKENSLNEVRILASVKHPHIIAYKEAFIDDTTSCLCLITELATNGDLFMKVQNSQKSNCYIHEGEAWKIFIQVVFGLKRLHDMKIFHRDLKSANVFLFKDGSVKLGDMNVSKVAKQGLLFTQTGTPYYASPEVWRDQPYDSKSDIWSLGCILYEMIALKPPFKGADMENLYQQVLAGKYQAIPNVYSQDMGNVIKSMLQVNPKMRPTCLTILTMESVKKRIEKYFSVHYLINERLTYQGQKKREIDIEENKVNQDELLRTIRLTDNIFSLKDRLPTPQYPGEAQRSRRNRSVQRSLDYQSQQNKTETEKKIENIMPLSYITPQKKEQSVTRIPSNSIEAFEIEPKTKEQLLQGDKRLQPRIPKRFTSKKNSVKPTLPQPQQPFNIKSSQHQVFLSQDFVTKDRSQQNFMPPDHVTSMKRDMSQVAIPSKKEKPPKQQSASLKSSASATNNLQLPRIEHAPKSSTIQSDYSIIGSSMHAKKHSLKKNILLINVNNHLKNEHVPMSYLKGKQTIAITSQPPLFNKDALLNRSPIINRYSAQSQDNLILPELRGLSLESYKYIQDNNSKVITLKPLDDRAVSIPLLAHTQSKQSQSQIEDRPLKSIPSQNFVGDRRIGEKSLKSLIVSQSLQ